MQNDFNQTGIEGSENILKDISIMPSTLETIDYAFYNYINEKLNLFTDTNKGRVKVPVLWVTAERAFQVKNNKGLRDKNGILKLPIISIERTGVKKDPEMKGVAWANIPEQNDEKGGAVKVARRIKQDKTSNFLNADSFRKAGTMSSATVGVGQLNFPNRNRGKVVYETITMPIPTYINVTYEVMIKTEYQQQMNDLISPFLAKTGQITNFFIKHEGHKFEGFIDGSLAIKNNLSNLAEAERAYETTINIRILGYILGEGSNRDRPKITIRENAVEVKLPREQVIVGDIPQHASDTTLKLFYRE